MCKYFSRDTISQALFTNPVLFRASRLEFQESVIKLALKSATFHNHNHDFNFLLVASAHVEPDSSLISLIIEQFDIGQKQFSNSNSSSQVTLSPSAPIPDALYIPSRLVYETDQPTDHVQSNSSVAFYMTATNYLANYFYKLCSSIESIAKIMSLSSSIYATNSAPSFNAQGTVLNASFELITLANCFEAQRVQPMSIIETSLLKTLQSTQNFFIKPKTGYCALYKNENVVLLMDSEPKATKVPLMGV